MQFVLGNYTNLQLHATVAKPKISSNERGLSRFFGDGGLLSKVHTHVYDKSTSFNTIHA